MSYFRTRGRWSYYRPGLGGGFAFMPPVIKWLLIVNAGLWLLLGVLLRPFTYRGVPLFLAKKVIEPKLKELIPVEMLKGGSWEKGSKVGQQGNIVEVVR